MLNTKAAAKKYIFSELAKGSEIFFYFIKKRTSPLFFLRIANIDF